MNEEFIKYTLARDYLNAIDKYNFYSSMCDTLHDKGGYYPYSSEHYALMKFYDGQAEILSEYILNLAGKSDFLADYFAETWVREYAPDQKEK